MTLDALGTSTGTPHERRDTKKATKLSKDSVAAKNGFSSLRQPHAQSDKLGNRLLEDGKRRSKPGISHQLSENSKMNPGTGQSHSGSYMSHRSASLVTPFADSSSFHGEHSVSREPGSDLEKAIETLAQKRSDIPSESRSGKVSGDILANAKDSLLLLSSLSELKRSTSETTMYRGRDAEFKRYEKKPSSKIESRKTKSNALVTKRNSKFMLINEKLNQSGLPSVAADTRPLNGRVFGCLFFTGKTGILAKAEVKKEGKKYISRNNNRKAIKHSTSKRDTNEDKKKSKKNTGEKRTKHHSEAKKPKRSDGDLQTKASKSHPKKPEKKDRKKTKASSSKDLKTLCEVEISQRKKVSGLVVKVCGKRA